MSQSDKVPRIITFTGIQISGKSAFFQQNLTRDFVHINLDSLHTRTKEAKLLEECLEQRASFVMDNTDSTAGDRKRYIQVTRENGHEVEGCSFQSLVKDCIQRNFRRLRKACVPDRATAYTSNRLEVPTHDEGFGRSYSACIRNGEFKVDKWKDQCLNGKER